MLYGILINGYLATTTEENGKPVIYTTHEEPQEGYCYKPSWEENDDNIVQVWTLEEAEETEAEILNILTGETP